MSLHKYTPEKAAYDIKWREKFKKQNLTTYHMSSKQVEYRQSPKRRYAQLRSSARLRGLSMTLTYEQWTMLISNPRYYCGRALAEIGGGLDRIDSEAGYVIGNVRPCCPICNVAKSDLTETEFKDWVRAIAEHWI